MAGMTKVEADTRREAALYTADELMPHAEDLFGVRKEVVHAALCGESEKRFTVEQVRQKIKQFMKAKVK
ncbi:hypothetical protein [Saccharibacillus sacchari]|uniref:Uncharacterized protein n=1 Tax=Saccharibacillus sacchari TaxID=456493 RepID=A0ACC6PI60_9BACL